MAKLSTYVKDTSISGEDLLVGSNYIGVDNYATNNFKIKDLSDYFAGQITTDPLQLSLKTNGGLVFETINNGNYLAVDLSATNITGQLANSDLVNSSITINSTVVSLGGSIDIPVGDITAVEAGTYLNGGGTTGDVTVNHDLTSRSDTTASSTITSTFTAITSITSNATGHITSEETTTYTLPTDIYVNSAAVTGTNTKTITLGRTGGQSNVVAEFDDLDTTYGMSALATNNNADALIRLTAGGSGSGTDDVTLAAGTNINLNVTGDTIEIESTAFGDVYEAASESAMLALSTVQGDIVVRTDESKTYIKNDGTTGTMTDFTELQFSGIQNINLTAADEIELSRTSLTQTNNDLTIGHLDVTRTNTTSTASPAHGGTFTAIDSLTSNARGHITGVNTKTITLPDDDDNYADTLSITGNTTKTVTIGRTGSLTDLTDTFTDNDNYVDSIVITEPTSTTKRITIGRTGSLIDLTADFTDNDTIPNDATITLSAGTYISGGGNFTTDQSANETITFNHDNTTRTNTTSSVSPAHQASFTAIDTITTNATGHVTAVNTKTITLPSDDDNDTTYSISAETATGGANLRLTGSDSTTDDVVYKGNGATTVTRTDANTITISSTDTKQATVWKAVDDDGDQVDIAHNKYLKFVSSIGTAGTNLSGAGTSGDPYVMTITSPNDNTTNWYVANSAGTDQFQITEGEEVKFAASGATSVAFDAATQKITYSHSDTSSQGSVNNSGNTFIQDVTLDTYGHVTGLTSTTVSIGNGTLTVQGTGALGGSGTFTANQSGDTTISISHDDTSTLNGTYGSTADGTKIDQITVDAYGHVTSITTGPVLDTTYTAGSGLSLNGTQFNADINYLSYSGSNNFIVSGTQNNLGSSIPTNAIIIYQDTSASQIVSRGYVSDLPFTNVTNNNQLTNGANYITASSTDTLTNKSGNISQWTNDANYFSSAGGTFTGDITISDADPQLILNDNTVNSTSTTYTPAILFRADNVNKAMLGKFSSSSNIFYLQNFDGPISITGSQDSKTISAVFAHEPSNTSGHYGLLLNDTSTQSHSLYIGVNSHTQSSLFFNGTVNALNVSRISHNNSLGILLIDVPDAGTSTLSAKFRQYNTGGYMQNFIDFHDDSDIRNVTGVYGTIVSDERAKENITNATPKLDDILSLQVKNFNFIGDDKKHIGLIAQDVEQIFPSWVDTKDTRIYKTHDENGVPLTEQGELVSGFEDGKSLKVGMEFAVMVKVVQELNDKIESLEARIAQLETP